MALSKIMRRILRKTTLLTTINTIFSSTTPCLSQIIYKSALASRIWTRCHPRQTRALTTRMDLIWPPLPTTFNHKCSSKCPCARIDPNLPRLALVIRSAQAQAVNGCNLVVFLILVDSPSFTLDTRTKICNRPKFSLSSRRVLVTIIFIKIKQHRMPSSPLVKRKDLVQLAANPNKSARRHNSTAVATQTYR